ncbi:MAG: nucleotidyltransferase [Pirellulales bacterium]
MMKKITDTLHALVELLDQLSIEYAVMGGFAVRAHGVPRPTYDIDVTIVLERQRLPELFDRLRDYDFAIPEAYETGWVDRIKDMPLLKLRRYIRGESLDVDLFIAESEFQAEVIKRRSRVDADGRILWVVSPEDLVLLKLLAGRPRDLGDVADVLFMQGKLDDVYMRRWARELGIGEQLKTALAELIDDQTA